MKCLGALLDSEGSPGVSIGEVDLSSAVDEVTSRVTKSLGVVGPGN